MRLVVTASNCGKKHVNQIREQGVAWRAQGHYRKLLGITPVLFGANSRLQPEPAIIMSTVLIYGRTPQITKTYLSGRCACSSLAWARLEQNLMHDLCPLCQGHRVGLLRLELVELQSVGRKEMVMSCPSFGIRNREGKYEYLTVYLPTH